LKSVGTRLAGKIAYGTAVTQLKRLAVRSATRARAKVRISGGQLYAPRHLAKIYTLNAAADFLEVAALELRRQLHRQWRNSRSIRSRGYQSVTARAA
jgi:hypothetical protein